MSLIEDFKKLSGSELVIGIFAFTSVVCPGVLAIWLFNPKMIESLSTSKLLLLSASFMVPAVSINTMLAGSSWFLRNQQRRQLLEDFFWGGVATIREFAVALVVCYWNKSGVEWFLPALLAAKLGWFLWAKVILLIGKSRFVRH